MFAVTFVFMCLQKENGEREVCKTEHSKEKNVTA